MAIQSTNNAAGLITSREARPAQTENRIREATLSQTSTLSPGEVKQHQAYCNQAVADVDRVKHGNSLEESRLDKLFPHRKDDSKVDKATKPRETDNKEAASIRSEYKKAYREAKRERARAARLAAKLGPGEHKLSNGDKVKVKIDPETGQKTVTTTKKDGTSKTVSFNDSDPGSVSVTTRNPDGSVDSLTRQGTKVTKGHTGKNGSKTSDEFNVNEKGEPVKVSRGPKGDDEKTTTVAPDGSTHIRDLIYKDEHNKPVYHDTHQPPKDCGCDPVTPGTDPVSEPVDACPPEEVSPEEMDEAGQPRPSDNDKAVIIRKDYKELQDKVKSEKNRAQREVEKLGPGKHKLSNGDEVEITVDPETGDKTVKTTSPDGKVKTVRFNDKDPDTVVISTKNPDGSTETIVQKGNHIKKSETDSEGKTKTKHYSVNDKEDLVCKESGPEGDDETTTTVHDDGSTDSQKLIYREEDGTPVYEELHEDGRKDDDCSCEATA